MTVYEEIEILCDNAGAASAKLALADTQTKNAVLLRIADALSESLDRSKNYHGNA